MNVERDILTLMFNGDLELAKSFLSIGELRCAREHLQAAAAKLDQIAALECDPHAPATEMKNITQPGA